MTCTPLEILPQASTAVQVRAMVNVLPQAAVTWSAKEMLTDPQASVAVQVRTIVAVLPQSAVTTSLCVMVTWPPASVALALPAFAGVVSAGNWSVTSAAQTITGGVVSTTVIV